MVTELLRTPKCVAIRAHTQFKLQYDLGRNDSGRSGFGHMIAAQLTLRF
ncbi:MAG: hypothetical protein QOE70_568 [Chthoniobacter sp.]|jgi:hypothetical protein|nr:hypothetical protein [Chthoniobacter sp.]